VSTLNRRSPQSGPTKSSLGKSVVVTFRIPDGLYRQLRALGAQVFQPVPTLLRAAAVEYVQRRMSLPTGASSGLFIQYPDDTPGEPPAIDANPVNPEDIHEE
jgi:hypothetical protein